MQPKSGQDVPRWSRRAKVLTAVALVVLLGATAVLVASRHSRRLLALGGSPALAGQTATTQSANSQTSTTGTTTTTAPPLPQVVSFLPRPGATNVELTATAQVVLSAAPQPGAPMPSLQPPVPGQWSEQGTTFTFAPSQPYVPWSTEHIIVPPSLATGGSSAFTVQGVSMLRVQQLLAELHYLPLRFGPSPSQSALPGEAQVASQVSPFASAGEFTWRFPNIPATLSALWAPGEANVITQGAVMAFEADHGLTVDGLAGPVVWRALTAAVAERQVSTQPYDYLTVSEALPEHLVVWQDGQDVYSAPANTGVDGAQTPLGTWPVYERFATTTMVGTDPNGYHYHVTGVPWVAYFYEGDAVHGYWRASYGWPQSNGCVELPVTDAKVVWTMDPIGALVTVIN